MSDEIKKTIILNGVELTESEFNLKKQEIDKQKGVQLIQESTGIYKTRLYD
jgi:hypothetical protein